MDVFVLPSLSEVWGLVVEEALNSRLPVIVSNRVGCAEEIINESNGLAFDNNSTVSLEECVKKVPKIKLIMPLDKI